MKLIGYLTVCALIAQAFAIEAVNVTTISIEDLVSKGCNGGKGTWTEVPNGMGFSCDKPAWTRPHHIFTSELNLKGSKGSYTVNKSPTSFYSVPGANLQYRYGGCVDSSWGTFRCAFYNYQKSIEEVVKLPEICTADGVFCFQVPSDVCKFSFGNQKWERICPNLRSIEFNQ